MSIIINRKICPRNLKNNPNCKLEQIQYITIHNTGNYAPGATAKMHADYQYKGASGREASWHYTVDKDEVWQSFEDNAMCWHAGNQAGNRTSIGIEICDNDRDGFSRACKNAAELTALLLKRYSLPITAVKQHYDWSGKDCPKEIRGGNWGVTWQEFVGMVNEALADDPKGGGVVAPIAAATVTAAPVQALAPTETRSNIPILNKPTASMAQLTKYLESKNTPKYYIDLLPKFWEYSVKAGVDPCVAVCQSAKETAFGKFGGVLDASYCNPCGMKKTAGGGDTDPAAHKRFEDWDEGIQAHVDHLALYAGAASYPKTPTPDPRHFPNICATAKSVTALGGKWAPSPAYGEDIVKMMDAVSKISVAETAPTTVTATDAPDAWAAEAWSWGIGAGITDGSRPKDMVKRQEVVQLIFNYNKTR